MSDIMFRHSHRGFSTVEQTYDRSAESWKSRVVTSNGDVLEEWDGLTHPSDIQAEEEGMAPVEAYPYCCEECGQWHWFENNFAGGRLAFQHFQQCHPTGWFYRE